jgi:hypothetical protein
MKPFKHNRDHMAICCEELARLQRGNIREAIKTPLLYPATLGQPLRSLAQVAADSRREAILWSIAHVNR